MMYVITVAICLQGTPYADCRPNNAHNKVIVPERAPSVAMCFLAGQAYVAHVGLVHEGDVVKVFCQAEQDM